MLVTQFDKFVNRSTQEILGSEIEQENLEPMLSTDIVRSSGNVTGVKGEKEIYYRTGNVNITSEDIGSLNVDNVYNGLDKSEAGYALDARQGKVLNEAIDDKLDKANVYNGLDKTEAGYALDASQGKVLADKLDATQADIAIIIYGNQTTHTGGVAVGEYAIVRNSTISGITDGLYKAVQAIPANTVIDSTYLAAMSGGGLNALNGRLIQYLDTTIRVSSAISKGDATAIDIETLMQGKIPINVCSFAGALAAATIMLMHYNGAWRIRIVAVQNSISQGNYDIRIYYYIP